MNRRERRRQRAIARSRGIDRGLEQARHNDIREVVGPEIRKILEMGEQQGKDFAGMAIVVLDPSSAVLKYGIAQAQVDAHGGPTVGMLTREMVYEVMSEVGDSEDAQNFRLLPAEDIPIVTFAGKSIKVEVIRRSVVSSAMDKAFITGPGGAQMVDARGILWLLYHVDAEDVAERGRDRIEDFQDAARLGYDRERTKPNPRPLDVFLYEEFGGKEIREAMKHGDINRAIEIPLTPSSRVRGVN